ncbi:dTDP-4-dehydrorhamnose reductase [Mariniflexile ostreae]|uniref:dTDP-4-dehydrorhamnose reductase n=1 Tax=Mariniflexile ostreae TaxID=1520892 RepID=A0ABV5F721_9FLAO
MNKKVLVTGASGQLGKTIKALFYQTQKEIDFVFVSKEQLDISNEEVLQSFFNMNTFDYCINCAAYTNVEQAEKTPEIAYQINAEGVKYLAEACKTHEIVLIHISTDYVFDGEKETPYTTTDIPNPINVYGESKLLGERHIQRILEKYFIIRTSWLYSKKFGNNFYKTILKKAETETELSITIENLGCPTNTVTLATYIFNIINQPSTNFGVLHFCDEKVMTWYDFAKDILKENQLLNTINLVKVNNYRTFARRPKYSVLLNTHDIEYI